ncbi:hypothetical protein F2Q70_00045065 [Brassica cretica]|uniref:Uncharacterized protein n=1 Tax=Brassica cretica TaxID=69181 RepID=A0A8S9LQA8_BRACR|nr:hypothetical protein F2Q70_00045065 [Brassica cretica]KAF2608722.1 hypothetical protein F2Q68_00046051 [Brassica cretica]
MDGVQSIVTTFSQSPGQSNASGLSDAFYDRPVWAVPPLRGRSMALVRFSLDRPTMCS